MSSTLGCGESGQAAARQFFLQLVAVGEGEADTRRPVALADLASLDVDQEALTECLDAFGTSRLLSFNRDPRTGASTVDIAHEALLVEWGRLREWIDGAREEVRAHRRLTVRAAEWAESAHDPSFLLRGTELARFEAWAGESGLAQTVLERDFLRGSLDEREAVLAEEESRRVKQAALERHAVNRLRALVAVLAVAAVAAAGLTVYAFDQSDRSHHQTRIATARQLAAASVANLDVDPELSILLARQAVQEASVNGAPLPDAVDALHRALAASRVVLTIRTPATAAIAAQPRRLSSRHCRLDRDRRGCNRLRLRRPGSQRRSRLGGRRNKGIRLGHRNREAAALTRRGDVADPRRHLQPGRVPDRDRSPRRNGDGVGCPHRQALVRPAQSRHRRGMPGGWLQPGREEARDRRRPGPRPDLGARHPASPAYDRRHPAGVRSRMEPGRHVGRRRPVRRLQLLVVRYASVGRSHRPARVPDQGVGGGLRPAVLPRRSLSRDADLQWHGSDLGDRESAAGGHAHGSFRAGGRSCIQP